ncbi:YesL family protein [Alkalicoccobacillus porphyridii]|uniref:DUF624 domain-containing protein n=1 Tax=Alkalicoccobacillus porphyridii TaxID=2597270 RepID=A0A553ZVH1_9BACI|nr:DUF624 domain-containing protein [Alkalicoccobacillus porphyridii]TSB45480.1 DUF624 domain-containing protein [Alkalicoccobacillus porphyridii]
MTGVRERILNALENVSVLAYLNILWIIFTLLGLIVGGFFPATVAMYTLIRRWLQTAELESPFKAFWQEYKKHFWSANLYGYIFFLTGTVLVVDLMILASLGTTFGYIVTSILTTFTIVFLLMSVFCLPVFVHFKGKPLQLVRKSLQLAIPCLPYALLSLLLTAVLLLILFFVPAAGVFFSGSIVALLNMKLFLSAIQRLEQKHVSSEVSSL